MSVPTTRGAPAFPADGDLQAGFVATLVDEWLCGGVCDAVICPGSRSAPLALALAGRPELRVHVRLDERSAGFFALGLSLATGRPTVVCTTSGTAAAELHPAVAEADLARVPLLVCTADRPPELHHVGAPQVIDQDHLFGRAVRWFCAPGVADEAGRGAWRSLAARSVAEATVGPHGPGPVQLNLAFREPLSTPPAAPDPGPGEPVHRVHRDGAGSAAGAGLLDQWRADPGHRGLLVAGAGCGAPAHVLALADRLGWPVLADPRSGCRRAGAHGVVAAADALLRDAEVADALRPDTVLQLGAAWSSKVLAAFVAGAARPSPGRPAARMVTVDPWWQWRDPDRLGGDVIVAEPSGWTSAAVAHLGPTTAAPGAWHDTWVRVERAAQGALDRVLGTDGARAVVPAAPLNEPLAARLLLGAVGAGTRVVVASSMPVRDLEWFTPPLDDPPVVLANRGANGIDGVSSTALGVAAAGGAPVVGLLGDLAFLHDASALVRPEHGPSQEAAPCTLVVLDNHGGGIFSFLAQAADDDRARFEALFGTPQRTSVADVARGFGLGVTEVTTAAELVGALAPAAGGSPGPAEPVPTVVRVVVPGRDENVALHERVQAEVGSAARAALAR